MAADRQVATDELVVLLGLDPATVRSLLSRPRLRFETADYVAVALGHHPCEIWPEWFSCGRPAPTAGHRG